tara:strand:+ start:140 stop:340 length:201 start_codon:yes stop_codon:yes gene_type:complete
VIPHHLNIINIRNSALVDVFFAFHQRHSIMLENSLEKIAVVKVDDALDSTLEALVGNRRWTWRLSI